MADTNTRKNNFFFSRETITGILGCELSFSRFSGFNMNLNIGFSKQIVRISAF